MPNDNSKLTRQEVLMKRAQALEELEKVYADLLRLSDDNGTNSLKIEVSNKNATDPDESLNEKLVRLPLGDACVEFLNSCKKPQLAKEIWAALEQAGRASESASPVKSVGWALKKLIAQGHDDIFSPGFGQWHLKSKYSTRHLNKIQKSTAGKGGKSREEHINRTRAGIERARAEGKQIGIPRRIKIDHIREMRRLLDEEGTTIKAACEAVGVSYGYYNINKKAIRGWQEGDPWPLPKERLKELEAPHVRLIASKE